MNVILNMNITIKYLIQRINAKRTNEGKILYNFVQRFRNSIRADKSRFVSKDTL